MNEPYIADFIENCEALGNSQRTVDKHKWILKNVSEWAGKDFKTVTKADMQTLIRNIEKSNYADWTKHNYKASIKKFWRFLKGRNQRDPIETRWFNTGMKSSKLKLPEELLTQKEVLSLIQACATYKHKCLISLLYESGARIDELLSCKIKNLVMNENYLKLTFPESKTQKRVLPLVFSLPYIKNYINKSHAYNDDPNAYIFYGTDKYRKISYNAVRKQLLIAKRKTGLKKAVNPHNFRHSRASYLANHLTESQMKYYFGWTQGSNMASIYVHLSGRDLDPAILGRINGLKEVKKEVRDDILNPKVCPRCKENNESSSKYCDKCWLALDTKSLMKEKETEDEIKDVFRFALKNPDMSFTEIMDKFRKD